jgi:hypothetical protein
MDLLYRCQDDADELYSSGTKILPDCFNANSPLPA